MPTFIHAVSPYRQYDSAMTLQMVARGAAIPVDVYKLNVGEGVTSPTQKFSKAAEFLRQLDNSGLRGNRKDQAGAGERIITIEGLYEYEQIAPQIDILQGQGSDLEALENNLIQATKAPRGYFDADNSAFGNLGASLIQQFKPFAREIYTIQKSILNGIVELTNIHLILNGKGDNTDDYTLTMPFPESQTDNDYISSQESLISLANNILDNLAEKFLDGASAYELPTELKRTVYTQILPYDKTRIDNWVDQISGSKNENEQIEENRKKIYNELSEKYKDSEMSETIKKCNI